MSNEIWVLIEKARHADNIAAISRELLGKGRQLADTSGVTLSALVLGSGVGGLAERAFAYGADKAYVVDDAALAQYTTDGFVGAAAALAKQYTPALILTGATFQMRDLSAALAAELGAGLAIDATNVTVEGDQISALRPSHGGNVINTITFGSARPAVIAVRKQVFPEAAEQAGRSGELVQAAMPGVEIRTKVTNVAAKQGAVNLADAAIIVSGGRGLATPRTTSSSSRRWPRRLAVPTARRARSSTPAGFPTSTRSARPARPSARNCTWPSASPARSSTSPACAPRAQSWRSTRMPMRRSSAWHPMASWAMPARLCRC